MAPVSHKCQWCAAVNCSNSRQKNPDLSFFRFPRDVDRSKRWAINLGRADLDKKDPATLYKSLVLCEQHFEESCFSSTAKNRKYLKRSAVPTLFDIPNPPTQFTPSRPPPKERLFIATESRPTTSNIDSPAPSQGTQQEDISFSSTANIDKLERRLKVNRSRIWRSRQKLIKREKEQEKQASQPATDTANLQDFRQMLSGIMSPAAVEFILTQVSVSKVCKKGRRWTSRDKSLALSFFHASRKAYRLLQKLFKLPSTATLKKAMKNIHIKTGINRNFMHLFEIKVTTMTDHEKLCIVMFDEMSLKAFLQYNPLDDEVEGFEDFGLLGRSQKYATQVLVFMVRGLTTKWKQPISFYLSQGPVKSTMLKSLLFETLDAIILIALNPILVISDQGSNNRSLFNGLNVTAHSPYFFHNSHKYFVMYDPPHLLKSVRNNLKLHGFMINERQVSWQHICSFYEADQKSDIRTAPKLTKRHITMPPFSHLRVRLAAQILSHSVAAGIASMVSFKALPSEAMETAKFCEIFDSLFNCFNSNSRKGTKPMTHAIDNKSNHVAFLQNIIMA